MTRDFTLNFFFVDEMLYTRLIFLVDTLYINLTSDYTNVCFTSFHPIYDSVHPSTLKSTNY